MLVDDLVYPLAAQEIDLMPSKNLDEIKLSVEERLQGVLDPSIINQLDTNIDLTKVFHRRLVVNPKYWRSELRCQHRLYFLKTNTGKFNEFVDMLYKDFPEASLFVCYGEIDGVVYVVGSNHDLELIEEMLKKEGFFQFRLVVDNIPFYYGYEVPQKQEFMKPNLDGEKIDQVLTASITEGCDEVDEILKELTTAGVILGQIYFEEVHLTNRIRAFIGVQFVDTIRPQGRQQFEKGLLEINKLARQRFQSAPLSTIYSCDGAYPYLLEMIFGSQAQLDQFTDQLQQVQPSVSDTITIIVAKASFGSPRFTKKRQVTVERYDATKQIVNDSLKPVLERLYDGLPPGLDAVFMTSKAQEKFQVAKLYDELVMNNPYAQPQDLALTEEYFLEFLRGVLENKSSIIKGAGLGLVRDVVEVEHHKFFEALLNIFFEGSATRFQSEIKLDNELWRRWGMVKWANFVYPRWNKHKLFGVAVSIPDRTLHSLELIGLARNDFAHTRENKSLEELVHQVREAFNHAYRILGWLPIARATFDQKIVRATIEYARQSSAAIDSEYYQLLFAIQATQITMEELLKRMNTQADTRWDALRSDIDSLHAGNSVNLEHTLHLADELLLTKMPNHQKISAERVLSYLKETGVSLPQDVIANLLAGLTLYALGIV